MLPVRRDLHFHLPADRVCDWNGHGRMVSHFFNALSIFFPEGERFFIHSVRHYRDRVRDPELQRAVAAFIGQEAMHGREHTEYNALLEQAGLPAAACERRVVRLLTRVKRIQPPAMQLAATIALEHFTAIMADRLLRDFDASMQGAEPHYARVWRWHALEETEHKAVAFDVFRAIFGNGLRAWALRAFGLLAATLIFWPMVFVFHLRLIRADSRARGWRGWARLLNFQFGRIGSLRKLFFPWLDYFKPGFHPWQHDNRAFLRQIDEVVAEVGRAQPSVQTVQVA